MTAMVHRLCLGVLLLGPTVAFAACTGDDANLASDGVPDAGQAPNRSAFQCHFNFA
jgi:hypothetical protein